MLQVYLPTNSRHADGISIRYVQRTLFSGICVQKKGKTKHTYSDSDYRQTKKYMHVTNQYGKKRKKNGSRSKYT